LAALQEDGQFGCFTHHVDMQALKAIHKELKEVCMWGNSNTSMNSSGGSASGGGGKKNKRASKSSRSAKADGESEESKATSSQKRFKFETK